MIQQVKPDKPADQDGVSVEFPDGLRVYICRVPMDDFVQGAPTQLSVFVNTEDMGTKDHAVVHNDTNPKYPHQFPEMQILLNDATLYDCAPGANGIDRIEQEREKKLQEESLMAVWYTPQAIRDHFEADEDDVAEWVAQASDDDLKVISDWAVGGTDRTWECFHEVLVDCVRDKMRNPNA